MMSRLGLAAIAAGMACIGLTTYGADAATCDGICDAAGADGDVTASPDGGSYRYILTAGGPDGGGQIPDIGGNNGSTYTTDPFMALAGEAVTLFFNFVTADSDFSDYAWAELRTAANEHVAWLFTAQAGTAGIAAPGFDLPAVDATLSATSEPHVGGPGDAPVWSPLGDVHCFSEGCGYTGWIKSDYLISAAGDYIVTFGVANLIDGTYDSGLAFDGTIFDAPPSAVPLPAALPLFGASLVGLGAISRLARRRERAIA